MAKSVEGPAFYATGQRSAWRDVRAVLHPPYTAWHLSYVVLGAMIAPRVNWTTLIATLLAFFLAVGVAAHALDELRGRPLGTAMPSWLLSGAAALGLGGCEMNPLSFAPFGGLPDGVEPHNGRVTPPQVPGIGFETKAALRELFESLGAGR